MARFSDRMVPEVVQVFWAAMARGEFVTVAAVEAGTYREKGNRWLVAEGGIRPRRGRDLKGRCLTFAEREEIAVARAGGESMRAIARRLGRHPSTVSRELATVQRWLAYRVLTMLVRFGPLTAAARPRLYDNYRVVAQHPAPGEPLSLGIHTPGGHGRPGHFTSTPLVLRARQTLSAAS